VSAFGDFRHRACRCQRRLNHGRSIRWRNCNTLRQW